MNRTIELRVQLCVLMAVALLAGCESQPAPGAIEVIRAPLINGTIDVADEFDSVVRVLTSVGLCTGTLIRDRYVLTAAHCVCDARAVAGESFATVADASNCVPIADVQTWTNQTDDPRIVADVIPHPDYRQTFTEDGFITSSTSDIALLQLRGCADSDIDPSSLAASPLDPDFSGSVTQAGFGAIDCAETPSAERRFGANNVRSVSGELIRVRSDGDDPIIHVGDSGGPLFLPDGSVIAVTSSSACNQLAQFTRTSLFSGWINEQSATGLACVNGRPTQVGPAWTCDPAYYSDGVYCDCECGEADPDCDDALSIPTCGDAQLACDLTGRCADAPADGWHVAPERYGDGSVCHCNSGAPDPDCLPFDTSVDCEDGEVCDGSGACVASGRAFPNGWSCGADAYADGSVCDCDCGVLDPDCRLDGDVESSCPLDEVCTEHASCEKAPYDCATAATLEPDADTLTLDTCDFLNSYASTCGDDGSAASADVAVELKSPLQGGYELSVRADGFEPIVYKIERACASESDCNLVEGTSGDVGDAWVARLTTSGPSTDIIVIDGADGCGAIEVDYALVEDLCEPSTEVCDGVDNSCSGVIDDTGVQLCTPAPPNAIARECSGASGCLYSCQLGFADRDRQLGNGCEARIGTDSNANREVCDGVDNDGDDQIDESGAVGCPAVPNAIASSCSPQGTCAYECRSGFEDADDGLGNGCETGGGSTVDCASVGGGGVSWLFALFALGALLGTGRGRPAR